MFTEVTIRNDGNFAVDGPLIVVIDNVTDPSVRARDFDGMTPDGRPYYDFANLLVDGTLQPGEQTEARTVAFFDPNETQFAFVPVFLAQLNRSPEFFGQQDIEAIVGRPHHDTVQALDPDGDAIVYSLLIAPEGMTIDAQTGQIEWQPTAADLGNHSVTIQADDGRGRVAKKSFIVATIDPPPNRPPVFTSVPVVSAAIGQPYQYDADAHDADGDELSYSLVNAPAGMVIDRFTGNVRWTPSVVQAGQTTIRVVVDDDRGGTATQEYTISAQSVLTNHDPIIISNPITTAVFGEPYQYDVEAIDPDGDSLVYAAQIRRAYDLSIENPGFETPELADGVWNNSIVGWTLTGTGGLGAGTFNPASPNDFIAEAPGGNNVAWSHGPTISQVLGDVLTANFNYTVEVDVARLFGSSAYAVQLWAGGSLLAEDSSSLNLINGRDGGGFQRSTVAFTALPGDPQLGGALEIRLLATDREIDFDNVRLMAQQEVTVDIVDGLFEWVPTNNYLGTLDVELEVVDGRGGFDSQKFSIEVANVVTGELTIGDVDSNGLSYDGQSLRVNGVITATVTNGGTTDLDGPIEVAFFEDADFDGLFDPLVDNVLGGTVVTDPLAAGQRVAVAATLFGSVEFVENVIWGFVDSDNAVQEPDEQNNYARHECLFVPPVGEFDPVVEWSYTEGDVSGTPVVVDLDGDQIPEVVFAVKSQYLRAIRGTDGSLAWANNSVSLQGYSQLAAGDIDNDGRPEIVGVANGGYNLVAFEHDGAVKWSSATLSAPIRWGAPFDRRP